ncbi:hypothetical protein AVEN_216068-1 [Araneus ventricosus]|uniref:Retrotransposon gag domain-containing protein n=1 Tax=Araneus ventricosus TaxID=182803 RepID=A0A4Y2QIL3_ARAVE|nr:hypothetical protein AVEN_216068-1 [Araneus ventricosus]
MISCYDVFPLRASNIFVFGIPDCTVGSRILILLCVVVCPKESHLSSYVIEKFQGLARKEQSNLLTVKFFATESVDWGRSSVHSFGNRRTTGFFFFDAAEDFGLGFCFMTTEANVRGASSVVDFLIGVECCSWVGDVSIATTLPAVVVWTLVSSTTVDRTLAKFKAYFVPQRNVIYVRLKLFLLVERGGQSVDDFITDLRKELRNFDYGYLLDSVMVVQLVRRLRDANLHERLLRVTDLDITKTVANFKVHITEGQRIDAMKRFKSWQVVNPSFRTSEWVRRPSATRTKSLETGRRRCQYCGSRHVPGKSPVYGKQCRSFGKTNHIACVYMSKFVNRVG